MTDKLRDAAQQVEREAFEAKWATPTNCTWTGNGYCPTEYRAWSSESHALRWEGWKARAALAQQDAQAVPTQRQYEMALRQWDHWKSYALELQAKLVKYEGGSPMVLNTAPTPPAPKPLGWLAREAVECLQGAEMTWMPVWNRQCSSDPVPIFLGPSGVRWNEKLAIIFGEDHGKDC